MKYLGLDLGSKTLGISISDKNKIIASIYKTIRFDNEDYDSLLPHLKEIILKEDISKIILGLPKNMDNTLGHRAELILMFKKKLESFLNIEVILQDERLTSMEANKYMIMGNVRRNKRKEKVDHLAANIILQSYLDKEKNNGK